MSLLRNPYFWESVLSLKLIFVPCIAGLIIFWYFIAPLLWKDFSPEILLPDDFFLKFVLSLLSVGVSTHWKLWIVLYCFFGGFVCEVLLFSITFEDFRSARRFEMLTWPCFTALLSFAWAARALSIWRICCLQLSPEVVLALLWFTELEPAVTGVQFCDGNIFW